MIEDGDFTQASDVVQGALEPLDMGDEGLKGVVERLTALGARAKHGQSGAVERFSIS